MPPQHLPASLQLAPADKQPWYCCRSSITFRIVLILPNRPVKLSITNKFGPEREHKPDVRQSRKASLKHFLPTESC